MLLRFLSLGGSRVSGGRKLEWQSTRFTGEKQGGDEMLRQVGWFTARA
jgi:hypothetical protein